MHFFFYNLLQECDVCILQKSICRFSYKYYYLFPVIKHKMLNETTWDAARPILQLVDVHAFPSS